jgi:hypothetical protein
MGVFMKAAALLLFVAAPAGAADQFDLVCQGRWRFNVTDPYEPRNFRMRVDLQAKRFCEEDCRATREIAEVQPNVITFERATDQPKALGTTFFFQVDRTNGKLTYFKSARLPERSWIEQDAICEPAPFSGFPELPKKF